MTTSQMQDASKRCLRDVTDSQCARGELKQINKSRMVGESALPTVRQYRALLGAMFLGLALLFAGCVTSPFLSENAAERLAAVDALADQRKLVEVALDYCTEPYQEMPSGCQMDVRIRAVERITDRDLLMAVASFSIVKTTIKGNSCYVSLGEANAKLRELALGKLTEGKYIPSVLAAKKPFSIQPLFAKAMFGYYQIAGNPPATAESAWLEKAKGKEASVAKSFCSCLVDGSPVELCKRVYGLLPASLSAETQKSVADSYKRVVTSASGVSDAVRALQLAEVVPASVVVKGDIDAMCKSVCSKVSSVGEFKDFGTLVNGVAKQYVSDAEGMIKSAATQVVQKLDGMQELADFASVLKPYTSPWVGQIGIEEQVRKCAMSVSNIGGIKTFASQLAFFNEVMLPNKTDIAGDAVIAVLNAVVEGKAVATAAQSEETDTKGRKRSRSGRSSSAQPGQKETIKDFVAAVTEFPADILSDKAIVTIIVNKELISSYESALRRDGYSDEMGNRLASAAMSSGSFGDFLVAGILMSSMGDKQSPVYNQLFSRILKFIRKADAMPVICSMTHNLSVIKLVFAETQSRFDSTCLAVCVNKAYPNFTESRWFREIVLATGEKFVRSNVELPLESIQPVILNYVNNEKGQYLFRAAYALTNPDLISDVINAQFGIKPKEVMPGVGIYVMRRPEVENRYFALMLGRANSLYERQGVEKAKAFRVKLVESVANLDSLYDSCKYGLDNSGRKFLFALAKIDVRLMADIVCKFKLEPISHEFEEILKSLSGDPSILVNFLSEYKNAHTSPFYVHKDPFWWRKKLGWQDITTKQLYRWRDDKTHDWHTFSPYYGFDLSADDPIWFYDCDWYWKALCTASAMELSDVDRQKLNEVMQYVALNALNLDVRKKVYEAIKSDEVKSRVENEWKKATDGAQNAMVSYIKLFKDNEITKAKKLKEWDNRYLARRVRMAAKFVDVSELTVYSSNNSRVDPERCVMSVELPEGMSASLVLQGCDKEAAMEYAKGAMVVFDCYPDFYDILDNRNLRRRGTFKMGQTRLVVEK